jgi:peptidoglycan/LPS O-acetylase OafA/YrhL
MSLKNKSSFRPDIAGLRAWAVLAVVLYHFGVPGFDGGFVGVDVFFVISGFLMTRIIVEGLQEKHGRPFSVLQFYLARARRIIPALFVLCGVLLVLGWFVLPFTDYKPLGMHVLTAALFASNIQFWREAGYFDTDSHDKWLLHTWSLSVEWQFYLVFPLVLWAIWKCWPGRKGTFAVVSVMLLSSLAISVWQTAIKPETAFFLLHTRAWEMLAGSLAALWTYRVLPPVLKGREWVLEALGFFMISAAAMTANPAHWPGAAAMLPVLGTILVLVAQRQTSVMTATPVLQRLGNWSYSIYLWHWPVVVALVYLGWQDEVGPVMAGLVVSVFLGWVSYRWVEPLGRIGQHWTTAKALLVFILAVSILGGAGLAVRLLNGVPGRLSPQVEVIAAAANDINPLRDKSHTLGGTEFKSHVYGGENVKAIVWGDSHASNIVTAVLAAQSNPQDGVLGMSYTSCPTLFGVQQERKDLHCAEFNEWALAKIEKLPVTVPVIIVNRSSAYLYGNLFNSSKLKPSIYFNNKFEENKNNLNFLEEYSIEYIKSICRISKNRTVYLMSPIPEMPSDVPRLMARNKFFNKSNEIYVDVHSYKSRNNVVMGLQDLAATKCNSKILSPFDYMCKDGKCRAHIGDVPLYYDDNHMSYSGSMSLLGLFDKIKY